MEKKEEGAPGSKLYLGGAGLGATAGGVLTGAEGLGATTGTSTGFLLIVF